MTVDFYPCSCVHRSTFTCYIFLEEDDLYIVEKLFWFDTKSFFLLSIIEFYSILFLFGCGHLDSIATEGIVLYN